MSVPSLLYNHFENKYNMCAWFPSFDSDQHNLIMLQDSIVADQHHLLRQSFSVLTQWSNTLHTSNVQLDFCSSDIGRGRLGVLDFRRDSRGGSLFLLGTCP